LVSWDITHTLQVAPHTITVVWLAVDLPTEIFGLVKLVLLHLDTMPMMAEKRHVVDADDSKTAQKDLPHLNLYYTTENGVCQEENKPRSDYSVAILVTFGTPMVTSWVTSATRRIAAGVECHALTSRSESVGLRGERRPGSRWRTGFVGWGIACWGTAVVSTTYRFRVVLFAVGQVSHMGLSFEGGV
jgi:hypothetical protein